MENVPPVPEESVNVPEANNMRRSVAPPTPGQPQTTEEIRAQRMQRQQARYRDRGGIFIPTMRNTLGDILLGKTKPLSPVKWINSPRRGGDDALPEYPSTGAKTRRRSSTRKSTGAAPAESASSNHAQALTPSPKKNAARARGGRKSGAATKGRKSKGNVQPPDEPSVDPSVELPEITEITSAPDSVEVEPSASKMKSVAKKAASVTQTKKSTKTQSSKKTPKTKLLITPAPAPPTALNDDDIPFARKSVSGANNVADLEDEIVDGLTEPKERKVIAEIEQEPSDDEIPAPMMSSKAKGKQRAVSTPQRKTQGTGRGKKGKGPTKNQPVEADPASEPELEAKRKPAAATRLSTIPESDSENVISSPVRSPSPALAPLAPSSPLPPPSILSSVKKRKADFDHEASSKRTKLDTKEDTRSAQDVPPKLPSKRSKVSQPISTIPNHAELDDMSTPDEDVAPEDHESPAKVKSSSERKSKLKRTREEDRIDEEGEEPITRGKAARGSNKRAKLTQEISVENEDLPKGRSKGKGAKTAAIKKSGKKGTPKNKDVEHLTTKSRGLKENSSTSRTKSKSVSSKVPTTKKQKPSAQPPPTKKLTKSRAFRPPPRKPRKSILERIRLHYHNVDEDENEPDPLDCLS